MKWSHRTLALVTMAIVVAAMVAATLLRPRGAPSPAAVEAAGIPDARHANVPSDPALRDAPFDTVRRQLEVAARTGDASAAYRLGMTIAGCMRYESVTDRRFDRLLSEAAATGGEMIRVGTRALGDEETIDLLLYAHGEQSRLCADTDVLRRDPPEQDGFYWIASAAELGHPPAMAAYGDLAFVEFATDADLVENAAEVARRRERAKHFLESAIARGEPAAFAASARAHAADGWLAAEPELAYTHLLVFLQTPDGRKMPPSLRRDVETNYAHGLSPAAQQRAAMSAAAVFARRTPRSEY